ncbi:PTS glucose transporter subunit IIA [Priestia flexa]|jgi:sugar PTS system EIIA component|uniref:PTS glucose transporter subunit IIA n=2 Tax=Priestia TaxID=2800373 RepID=A0A0V8JI06_9BACI|nr:MULTISPECIES: PTS glucose transporter subunit IIA [Bacillaceae]AQX54250.1 PTS glucose transporter subunit IIA [Priestia flexa]KSU86584.1 PTS glucose transporter subunit IIA [Priestia veravalensis]KZB90820.1 PTS glucose transporter subunit IIA [Bacillus sp. VT 712]MBN8251718.1 PTS glucose transporter subunit IIA [Priestia flexa]MBN8434865.1 PTS glucose transporter subunit IIA [Priestia flexa]
MFKKLFGGKTKSKETLVTAPMTGKILPLEQVPDPVFSQKMMGDGFAIEPTDGQVVSPVAGEVVQLFHTKHAVGLKTEAGTEVLIHIGLETVAMEGEGFEAHIQAGDKVEVGTPLITFDLPLVTEKAKSIITPVVITNSDAADSFEIVASGDVQKGQTQCAKVTMK